MSRIMDIKNKVNIKNVLSTAVGVLLLFANITLGSLKDDVRDLKDEVAQHNTVLMHHLQSHSPTLACQ